MHRTHEAVLAELEQRVCEAGTPLEDVDQRVAAQLGVPAEYYYAYLLVWGAIEAHRHRSPVPDVQDNGAVPALPEERRLVERLGGLVAGLCEYPDPLVARQAGEMLGAVLLLREALLDPESSCCGHRCGSCHGEQVWR